MRGVYPILKFLFIILATASVARGQNFIGLHKDSIKVLVPNDYPGFIFTKEVSNFDKSFIKFENTFEEQTLIFVLNEKGYCKYVSRMYNTWLFNKLKEDLDKKYGTSKNLIWVEKKDDKDFELELRKGKWFVTLMIRPKK